MTRLDVCVERMPSLQERYPDFHPKGITARLERWMYPGDRPNRLARGLNRGWAVLHGSGLLPSRLVTLEVRGRRTGRMLSYPLVMVDLDGDRYLVSMLGEDASWVRNVRAAAGHAILRHGGREAVRLDEVELNDRAAIVRRYVSIAPGPRAFIPVEPDAPIAAFHQVAPHIPVFRVRRHPSSRSEGPMLPVLSVLAVETELEGARVVDFPLRGEWMAVRTPASRIPSHGTDMLGQRYAFDLIRSGPTPGSRYHPAGSLRTLLFGVPTHEYYGWGEPIHAPLDGEVVTAGDGLLERRRIHPVRELVLVLKTGLTFRPTAGHLHRVMGNHVILKCGDVYAGFAHLTTGSVAVKTGQQVRVGDVLGRVGHTGNSSAPHLHFQLMDGPDPLTAHGIPCAFREYEVWRDGGWQRVERAIPVRTDRIRSVTG